MESYIPVTMMQHITQSYMRKQHNSTVETICYQSKKNHQTVCVAKYNAQINLDSTKIYILLQIRYKNDLFSTPSVSN